MLTSSISGGPRRARRLATLLGLGALALAGAGCGNTTEPVPDSGRAYYPVAVGNYWIYAVRDTTWSVATVANPRSTPRDSTYQLREEITETFADAAGQPAYRLVRSRRRAAPDAWVADSVFTLTATPAYVALNRGSVRTVELVLPPRPGRSWNLNAFNNRFNDTITAETRQYVAVGTPYSTGGGTSGLPATTYPNTVVTRNTGQAAESSLLREVSYQQVYAAGVGPVFRRRVHKVALSYTNPLPPNNQVFPPNAYTSAFTRRETLLESHVQ